MTALRIRSRPGEVAMLVPAPPLVHWEHPILKGATWCGAPVTKGYLEKTAPVTCVVCLDLDVSTNWWALHKGSGAA